MAPATQYQMISADSHVVEPPEVWRDRVPRKHVDRAPHMVSLEQGDAWVIEGLAEPLNFGFNQCASDPPETCSRWIRWEACRRGGYDPAARLGDLDRDRVDAEVLYPSPTIATPLFLNNRDPEFHLACIQAYNDWLSEFCTHAPERLLGLAMIPTAGVEAAAAELQRATVLPGIRGVLLGRFPSGALTPSPQDDPFWRETEAAGLPVSIHVSLAAPSAPMGSVRPSGSYRFVNVPATAMDFVVTGVFDRFPKLNLIFAEVECGWMGCLKEQVDISYKRGLMLPGLKIKHLPSHYLDNNVYCSFINDRFGVQNRHAIGLSQMLWSSDFPHGATTWPHSSEINQRNFEGVPAHERHQLLAGNAARVYRLPWGREAHARTP